MPSPDHLILLLALWIELVGSLILAAGCVRGLFALARSRASHAGIVRARLLVADGALWALDFKLGATLLKTLELTSWNQILMFAAILALRTFVKRALLWEERQLAARSAGAGPLERTAGSRDFRSSQADPCIRRAVPRSERLRPPPVPGLRA